MGKICYICGKTPLPLFRFPQDESVRAQWLHFSKLKAENISHATKLYMRHFKTEDVFTNSSISRLRKSAVPNLYPEITLSSSSNKRSRIKSCFLCQANDSSRAYFAFPENHHLRQQWLSFCGYDAPDMNTDVELDTKKYLCEIHFLNEDILAKRTEKGAYRLRPNTIPKIHVVPQCDVALPNSHQLSDLQLQVVERECLTIVVDEVACADDLPSTSNTFSESESQTVECEILASTSNTLSTELESQIVECEILASTSNTLPAELESQTVEYENEAVVDETDNIITRDSDQQSDFLSPTQETETTSTDLCTVKLHPNCSVCLNFIKHVHSAENSEYEHRPNQEVTSNTSINEILSTAVYTGQPSLNDEGKRNKKNKEFSSASNPSQTPPTSHLARKRRIAYLGDITTLDFDTPKRARRSFNLAKQEVLRCRKKIDVMNKKLRRRDSKLNSFKSMIAHLKNKSLISEEASLALIVSDWSP